MKTQDFYNTQFLIESPEQFDRISGKLLELGFSWYKDHATRRTTGKAMFAHRDGQDITCAEDTHGYYKSLDEDGGKWRSCTESDLFPVKIEITSEISCLLDTLDDIL